MILATLHAAAVLLSVLIAFKMGRDWDEFAATLRRRRRRRRYYRALRRAQKAAR